jgi:membrane protease YdiL (CAAX protease family)
MRSFLLFVFLLAGALILAAAVTYPAWLLVGTISVEPVHRVMNRVAMLLALIGLVVLTRRLGLSDRNSLGYGMPRPRFLRHMLIGWVAGIGLMSPLILLLLGLDVRESRASGAEPIVGLIFGALLTGITVAFIEETFFRGVLFTAVARTSGTLAAIIAPSALYASLHFLGGRLRVPAEEVSWEHGFLVLARLFERYAQPLELLDSFLALFMLGVLLSLVRLRTGAIAGCIGLHAAGVAAIAVLRKLTTVDEQAGYAVLVGSYDGVIGWAALAWFVIIAIAYYRLTARSAAQSPVSMLDVH